MPTNTADAPRSLASLPPAVAGEAKTAVRHLGHAAANVGSLALVTVVGSHAHGTAHDGSDVDVRGCYVADDELLRGWFDPPEQLEVPGYDGKVYELHKFVKMAVACQPEVLEVLFCPLVVTASPSGMALRSGRRRLLSERARDRYVGYAKSQLRKAQELAAGGPATGSLRDSRRRKHLRHTFRLLDQGYELLTTGELTVQVEDPGLLDHLASAPLGVVLAEMEQRKERLEQAGSVLPAHPDEREVHELLLEARRRVGPDTFPLG